MGAKDMGVPLATLEQTHNEHYQAAKKTEKDPDGGSYPAYPSGKSWDAASGKTGSGKKFYHNIIPGSAVKSEPFYVASGELVDIPRRVHFPHARLPWGPGCSEHPGGILRLGRHLQMRCWAHHLQHHCRKVRH